PAEYYEETISFQFPCSLLRLWPDSESASRCVRDGRPRPYDQPAVLPGRRHHRFIPGRPGGSAPYPARRPEGDLLQHLLFGRILRPALRAEAYAAAHGPGLAAARKASRRERDRLERRRYTGHQQGRQDRRGPRSGRWI